MHHAKVNAVIEYITGRTPADIASSGQSRSRRNVHHRMFMAYMLTQAAGWSQSTTAQLMNCDSKMVSYYVRHIPEDLKAHARRYIDNDESPTPAMEALVKEIGAVMIRMNLAELIIRRTGTRLAFEIQPA